MKECTCVTEFLAVVAAVFVLSIAQASPTKALTWRYYYPPSGSKAQTKCDSLKARYPSRAS